MHCECGQMTQVILELLDQKWIKDLEDDLEEAVTSTACLRSDFVHLGFAGFAAAHPEWPKPLCALRTRTNCISIKDLGCKPTQRRCSWKSETETSEMEGVEATTIFKTHWHLHCSENHRPVPQDPPCSSSGDLDL